MSSFVLSLMGVDAGEPLDHILIRKEAERKTGGNWWWGVGSNIAKELEREATSNGTLPVLFAAVARSNDGTPGQKACVWNRWRSRDGKRGGRIPDHALVISGYNESYFSTDPKEKKPPYYALVCQSEAKVARGNLGYFDPAKYLTPSGKTRGPSQRTALLIGAPDLQPHGLFKIDLKAELVTPWYVRLIEPRVLTPAQVDEVHRYRDGDDWRSLVRRLRGELPLLARSGG